MKRLGFANGVGRALMHLQDEQMIDMRGIDTWTSERVLHQEVASSVQKKKEKVVVGLGRFL